MPPANTEQQPPSCLQQLPGIRNTFGSLPAFFSSAGDPKVPISYDNTWGKPIDSLLIKFFISSQGKFFVYVLYSVRNVLVRENTHIDDVKHSPEEDYLCKNGTQSTDNLLWYCTMDPCCIYYSHYCMVILRICCPNVYL